MMSQSKDELSAKKDDSDQCSSRSPGNYANLGSVNLLIYIVAPELQQAQGTAQGTAIQYNGRQR